MLLPTLYIPGASYLVGAGNCRCEPMLEWSDVQKPKGSGGFSLTEGQHLHQYCPPNPCLTRGSQENCAKMFDRREHSG